MTNETLSQEIIKKSNQTVTVTDDLGREIVLKKPKWSSYLNLLKALGTELSKNQAYIDNVSVISTIVSIDGNPVTLKSAVDIDYTIQMLEKSDNALPLVVQTVIKEFNEHSTQEARNEALKK